MAFKALKVVTIGDKTFNPGDIIPDSLVEPRHIRSKKVETTKVETKVEKVEEVVETPTEELLVEAPEAPVEVVVETKKGKKRK